MHILGLVCVCVCVCVCVGGCNYRGQVEGQVEKEMTGKGFFKQDKLL